MSAAYGTGPRAAGVVAMVTQFNFGHLPSRGERVFERRIAVVGLAIGGAILPNTGVKLSMLAFGGLSLLFLGAAAYFAGRRRKSR